MRSEVGTYYITMHAIHRGGIARPQAEIDRDLRKLRFSKPMRHENKMDAEYSGHQVLGWRQEYLHKFSARIY